MLIRISILLFFMPIFGAKGVPTMWKAGVSITLALIITPVVPPIEIFPQTLPEVCLGVLAEILMGLILALSIKMLLTSVQMAGQFMSFQMGFAMARAMDPQTGVQSTVLTQFLYLFTILIFLSIDGHHMIILALARSFTIVPPNSLSFDSSIAGIIANISSQMFVIGLKIAAPIMVALFLSNLCLGIVARTVPQLNILLVGFPINICIGLILYILVLANISPLLTDLIKKMGNMFIRLIHLM